MTVHDVVRRYAAAALLAVPVMTFAQSAPDAAAPAADVPPHVLRLEGTGAHVVREGAATPLEPGDPVLFGDRLESGDAYVQVLWGDGTRVALDRGARLESLGADLLAVTAGRVVVERPGSVTTALRVDTAAGSFLLAPGGEYRFTIEEERTSLGVVTGRADVQNGLGERGVEMGYQVAARDGAAPGEPTRFSGAGYDSFVQWATQPTRPPGTGAPLETFADPRFEAYSDVFNQHGTWETDPQAGAVWFPTVGADWRPYTDGYWQAYGPESQWLWVGRDPWGWPTHHFGRWGMNGGGRWYWQPGRQWAPSWVSWSVGPGYIGWSPLGVQDQPLLPWDVVAQRRGVYPGGTLDPSRSWTIVPSDRFGERGRARAWAVDPRSLDNLSAFVSQRVGPPGRVGPRGPVYGVGPGATAPFGGPGGTTMYGPGGYYGGVRPRTGDDTTGALRRGIGPTRVGPPAPGYGGPTPPPVDPYERAQRAVEPRGRQRTPETAAPPAEAPATGTARPRTPPREATPPPARETPPATPPAAAAPPAETPPPAAPARTGGSGRPTGRTATPRP